MRFVLALCLVTFSVFGSDKASPVPHAELLMPAFRMSPILTQLEFLKPDGKNDKVRILVIQTLVDAGATEARPALEAILKEEAPSAELVKVTKDALEKLKGWSTGDRAPKIFFTHKPTKLADDLLQLLENSRTVVVRSLTAELLGKSGDTRYIKTLAEALKTETVPGVRFKIFQALAALDSAEARAVLTKLSEEKVSDEDKRYLEFFLAVKNHKEGNSKQLLETATPAPLPSKAEEKPNPVPAPVAGEIEGVQKLPLVSDKKDACVYLYKGKCYDSLDRLVAALGEPIDILSVVEGKEVCEKGILYAGKCFRSKEALLAYLTKKPAAQAPVEKLPAPEKKVVEAPVADEYQRFDTKKVKIGELHSRQGGYLTFGYYSRAGLRGPNTVVPHKVEPIEAFREEKGTKICFEVEPLKKLIPAIDEASLPVTETTAVVKHSMKIEGPNVCYALQTNSRGLFDADTDERKKINRDAEDLFKGVRGLEVLPKETQEKLKQLWASKKETYDRVEAVAGFWRTEVKYLLDDYDLYSKYFAANRDHSLLQAAVALKQGRCVPKNFGLGVAIYQLSEGTVPVRFAHVLWLEDAPKAPIDITLDRGHLQTQYLMPIPDQKRSVWVTAEASVSLDNQEQDTKVAKEGGDIRATVVKEMGARKKINVPLNAKIIAETTEYQTATDGGKTNRLTKMETKKLDKPRFEKSIMLIEEKDGKLIIRMRDDAPQVIPEMNLVDLAGGKPEHLAIFLGLRVTNRISFARTWQHLGGRRYRDVRQFTVLIPEGRNAVITDDMIFDFGSDSLLEKFTRSVDGELTVEVSP